jgi:hypothetical protein
MIGFICWTPSPSNEGLVSVLVVWQRAANAVSRRGPSDVGRFIVQTVVFSYPNPKDRTISIFARRCIWYMDPSVSANTDVLVPDGHTHYGLVIPMPEY